MLNKNLLNKWRLWVKNNNTVIQKGERRKGEREREREIENTEGDNVKKGRDIMEYNRNISSLHLILKLAVWGVTPAE